MKCSQRQGTGPYQAEGGDEDDVYYSMAFFSDSGCTQPHQSKEAVSVPYRECSGLNDDAEKAQVRVRMGYDAYTYIHAYIHAYIHTYIIYDLYDLYDTYIINMIYYVHT